MRKFTDALRAVHFHRVARIDHCNEINREKIQQLFGECDNLTSKHRHFCEIQTLRKILLLPPAPHAHDVRNQNCPDPLALKRREVEISDREIN